MFLDVLNLLYDCLDRVITILDKDALFYVGTVPISLWEIILGFFTVSIIFGFFLRPRPSAGISTFVNDYGKHYSTSPDGGSKE